MRRTKQDAIKWCQGALRQHERLCDSYDRWGETIGPDQPWDLPARQASGVVEDEYMVDGHLFLVTVHQLCVTLRTLDEVELLELLPNVEHITHARNASEHDDDKGLYQRDYQGYGWTVGSTDESGPYSIHGLELGPIVVALREIERRLGPTTVLE